MNCPVCDEKLRVVEKYGVEVDICPGCKGVWLDKGELDKILEMQDSGGPKSYKPEQREYRDTDVRKEHHDDRHYDDRNYPRKKKGSWLGDILESFGGD